MRAEDECGATRRLVISGSMAFYGYMYRLQDELAEEGVESLLPEAQDDLAELLPSAQFEALKREMSFAHIRRVKNPRTYGILVANFEKHSLPNYIGPSTFAEVAIAASQGKKIFILNEFPQVYAEELSLWGAIALRGRLDLLVRLYREACLRPIRQLNMFAA
jgi:hypothetical protein